MVKTSCCDLMVKVVRESYCYQVVKLHCCDREVKLSFSGRVVKVNFFDRTVKVSRCDQAIKVGCCEHVVKIDGCYRMVKARRCERVAGIHLYFLYLSISQSPPTSTFSYACFRIAREEGRTCSSVFQSHLILTSGSKTCFRADFCV